MLLQGVIASIEYTNELSSPNVSCYYDKSPPYALPAFERTIWICWCFPMFALLPRTPLCRVWLWTHPSLFWPVGSSWRINLCNMYELKSINLFSSLLRASISFSWLLTEKNALFYRFCRWDPEDGAPGVRLSTKPVRGWGQTFPKLHPTLLSSPLSTHVTQRSLWKDPKIYARLTSVHFHSVLAFLVSTENLAILSTFSGVFASF